MAFPNSVSGWLVGKNDGTSTSRGYFKTIGSSPQGHHRIAYELVGESGTTLTYRIYHQICLGLDSHVMTGYGVKYTYTINGSSISFVAKDGRTIWNSGPDGSASYNTAKKHYSNLSVSSGSYSYDLHSYTDTDREGSSTKKTWFSNDITFNKSNDGIVYFSVSYSNGPNSVNGPASSLKLSVSSVKIDTGKPAYTAPSTYSVSLSPNIGRVDYTNYGYNYTISGGTGTIDWVYLKVYPSNVNWNYGKYNKNLGGKEIYSKRVSDNTGKSSASGRGSFKCSTPEFKDGSTYKVAIHFSDSHYEWISGSDRPIYTYTKPDVGVTVKNLFSPQDEPTFSWKVNSGALGQENSFKTTVKLNNKVVSVTGTSLTITNSVLNQYFSAAERSVAQMKGTLYVETENVSAADDNNKYVDTDSQDFTVQYQPVKLPTNGSVSNSGQIVIIQDTPDTTVSWAYPHSVGAAGVVSGYIVRVFEDSSYSTQFGSDIIVTNAYVTLNNKTELKRGVLNYATITPYYNKPDGSGKIEGTQSLKVTLVKPISRINTPQISYPTNGAQWHNKHFRVLLQLPTDDDLSAIKSAYNLTNDTDYKYADIELKVVAGTQTFTYSINSDTTKGAFSANDMYYQRKIAINPSYLSNFPNTSEYTISIRVKKKYYNLPENLSWSNTATIKISNIAVNRQTFIAGQTEITSAQYSYVRNASVRLNKAYPFKSLDSRNIAQNKGDQIDTSEYAGIYQTIKDIQNGVNGYCTYDNTNIKLNQTIDDFTINPPKVELITADDNVSDIGRNYKNLLVDDMNKLY